MRGTILLMSGALKQATGLTGLAVAPDAHKSLSILYSKILSVVQKMPESAAYRKHTQVLISERLAAVKSEPTVAGLESRVNGGQVEELIIQAERELNLARRMLVWRAWEPLVAEAPNNQWKWPL